jgi:hypothetical protein
MLRSRIAKSEATAQSLAIELVPSPVENAADIERVITALAGTPDGGLLVLPSGTTSLHRDLVVELAARYRLPSVYPFRFYIAAGGLMSYSSDLVRPDQYQVLAKELVALQPSTCHPPACIPSMPGSVAHTIRSVSSNAPQCIASQHTDGSARLRNSKSFPLPS